MTGDASGKPSKGEPTTDWLRLRNMTNEEVQAAIIEDPEARATDQAFWKVARVVMPQPKTTVTTHLDESR